MSRSWTPGDLATVLHNEDVGVVVRADAATVAAAFADPAAHSVWGLRLTPYEDRGEQGMRCLVRGSLVGSVEWWLEPLPAGKVGVQVHFYLRVAATADGDRRPLREGWLARRQTRLRTAAVLRRWRLWADQTKDALEGRGRGAPQPTGRAISCARHSSRIPHSER